MAIEGKTIWTEKTIAKRAVGRHQRPSARPEGTPWSNLLLALTKHPLLLLGFGNPCCKRSPMIAQSFQFLSLVQVQKEGRPAIVRSPGRLATKIHSIVDGPGNPLGSILTVGQAFRYHSGSCLDPGFGFWHESDGSYQCAVNRNQQGEYDYHCYKDCNLVEHFGYKIKQFGHIAAHYKKLDRNFMSMLNLVSTIICLAYNINRP